LQLTIDRIVERRRDHVHLLYDLPNGTTLTQKVVASLALPITEILNMEDHKLNNTFLHLAFGLKSLLKPTSDQNDYDKN
jgi:hypothetical protein